jgi:hypothetical protein
MTKLRTIAATALAASTFGGAIGALATAAVQSQAAADTAAAAQQVQDTQAERSLQVIAGNTFALCKESKGYYHIYCHQR